MHTFELVSFLNATFLDHSNRFMDYLPIGNADLCLRRSFHIKRSRLWQMGKYTSHYFCPTCLGNLYMCSYFTLYHTRRWIWNFFFIVLSNLFNICFSGPINWFLSLPIFGVLNRFSYSMYLTHVTTLYMITYSTKLPVYFSDFYLVSIAKWKV